MNFTRPVPYELAVSEIPDYFLLLHIEEVIELIIIDHVPLRAGSNLR